MRLSSADYGYGVWATEGVAKARKIPGTLVQPEAVEVAVNSLLHQRLQPSLRLVDRPRRLDRRLEASPFRAAAGKDCMRSFV